jgi:hypothetical protein
MKTEIENRIQISGKQDAGLSGKVEGTLAQTDPSDPSDLSDSGHRAEPPAPRRINPPFQSSTNPFPQLSPLTTQRGLITAQPPCKKIEGCESLFKVGKGSKNARQI